MKKRVVLILALLLIGINGYNLYQNRDSLRLVPITGFQTSNSTAYASLTVVAAGVDAPLSFSARRSTTVNTNADLNWSNVAAAQYYEVFYSSNVTEIRTLNTSNPGAGVTNVSNITDLNWTDWTANNTIERYYRVASVNGQAKNLTNKTYGKYMIKIYSATGVPGSGVMRDLISFPLEDSNNSVDGMASGAANSDIAYRYNVTLATPNYQSIQFFAGFGWFGAFSIFEETQAYEFTPVGGSGYNITNVGENPQTNLTSQIYAATGVPGSGVMRNLFGWNSPVMGDMNTLAASASNSDIVYRYNVTLATPNYQSSQYFTGFGWFGAFDDFEAPLGYEFTPVGAAYNISYAR